MGFVFGAWVCLCSLDVVRVLEFGWLYGLVGCCFLVGLSLLGGVVMLSFIDCYFNSVVHTF